MTVAAVWTEGTFRAIPPAQTWHNVQPLMRRAGITRVAELTHLDSSGVTVHTACRPAATTLVMSQGKGVSGLLSKVSAVMESLELWFAEQPLVPALTGLSERAMGSRIGYPLSGLDVGEASLLTVDMPLDWSPAESIVTGRPSFVPTEYLQLDRRTGQTWRPPLFVMSTNGLASGNTVDEAALHGLCELIERDAIGRASPEVTARPVDPDRLGDAAVSSLVGTLTRRGNTVGLFDLTSRFRVPCFAAAVGGDGFAPRLFAGFGCHPDSAVAALRAITEAVQNRVTLIAGTRDDLATWRYDQLRAGSVPPAPRRPAAVPAVEVFPGDFRRSLRRLAGAVAELTGYEPLVARLTPEDCPIQVVRVVAPGLRFHDMSGLR
jgi:ribosomal protein S12 methylthiotransferase accessory factor